MLYVCDKVLNNNVVQYGVKDTDDGVVEYVTEQELQHYLQKGYKILGCSNLGVFELNENQLVSFETYIKLLTKFNKEQNANGGFKFGPTYGIVRPSNNLHARSFYAYSHGMVSTSSEIVFSLNSDGNIVCYKKYTNSMSTATIPGYTGEYTPNFVLYFGAKPNYPDYDRKHKYYTTLGSLYKQLVR